MGGSASKNQDEAPPAAQPEAPEQAMPPASAPPPEMSQPGEMTIPGWNPHVQCNGSTAGERAAWLTRNSGLSAEEAQERVMQEFPVAFHTGNEPAGWNPDVMCDGSSASARASWLITNKGLSLLAAQTQVMSEFSQSFAAGSGGSLAGWRGDADCGGSSAASRAQWLQENKALSLVEAQKQVMAEFPAIFRATASTVVAGPVAGWRGDVDCGGSSAVARAQWLQENKGLSPEEAQKQVMAEFPASFTGTSGGAVQGSVPGWRGDADCGGSSAAARAQWLQENKAMSLMEAQQQVMAEFAASFAPRAQDAGVTAARVAGPMWDPSIQCGEATAGARAEWLVNNKGMDHLEAQRLVMSEFAQQFLPVVSESDALAMWKDDVDCDGISSAVRLQWLVKKTGLTEGAAKSKLISEFAAAFSPGGVAVTAPAGDNLVSLGGSAVAAAMCLAKDVQLAPVLDAAKWKLVWSDEFNYTGPPDPTKWGYDVGGHGWGNNELQYYTDGGKNAWVSDGKLRITVKCESVEGRDYTSARLVTRGLGEWMYGRFEAKLRFPGARGSWSAFWMLPKDFSLGEWPHCGEIDIMEHVGHDRGMVHGTVHTGAFNHLKQTQVGKCFRTTIDDWHTYGVTWSPTKVEWFYDGQPYHSFEKKTDGGIEAWPFDQPFYLLFNLTVGGAWGGQKGVDQCAFETVPQCMDIEWVRVYQQS